MRTFLRRWIYGRLCYIRTKLSHLGPKDTKVSSLTYLVKREKEVFGLLFCADLEFGGRTWTSERMSIDTRGPGQEEGLAALSVEETATWLSCLIIMWQN